MYSLAIIQQWRRMALISALLILTSACAFQFPGVHKFNIQQGHIITEEMLDQLEMGQTKRQVAFVLGNPLLIDTFNPNRWDYYYSMRRANGDFIERHMTLYFEDDTLARMEGDYQPIATGEAAASGDIDLTTEEPEQIEPLMDGPEL